ncbi:hypothetical protein LTR33_019358, partial [Friedmanniomyces endolithicus]
RTRQRARRSWRVWRRKAGKRRVRLMVRVGRERPARRRRTCRLTAVERQQVARHRQWGWRRRSGDRRTRRRRAREMRWIRR